MAWSKLKQTLESFLHPSLQGRVEYRAGSYRFLPDKSGFCYITVDKKNILNMSDPTTSIKWYESELEIKNDPDIQVSITPEEIQAIRLDSKGAVPEDRLKVIARSRKISQYAKGLLSAQSTLSKSDFNVVANQFLTSSITPLASTMKIVDIGKTPSRRKI